MKLTFEGESFADCIRKVYEFTDEMRAIADGASIEKPEPKPKKKVKKVKRVKNSKLEGRPPADQESNKERQAQYKDAEICRKALQQVNALKGVPEAMKCLEKFGASKLSELKPEQYADFVEHCADASQ